MEELFKKTKNAKGCDGCDLNLDGHSCLIVFTKYKQIDCKYPDSFRYLPKTALLKKRF